MSLTSHIPSIQKTVDAANEYIKAVTHPGTITFVDPHGELNPEHIAESIKSSLRVSGVK
jgi:hypothetical protein